MGTASDDDLANYAPNVIVKVATPDPYKHVVVPDPGDLGPAAFEWFDIVTLGFTEIAKDETSNLVSRARHMNQLYYHIKLYGNSGQVVKKTTTTTTSSTTTTTAPPGPPPPPHIFTTGDANDLIPSVDEAPPFTTIAYIPQDLVGLNPPKNPPKAPPLAPPTGSPPGPPPPPPEVTTPKNPKVWSPLELTSLPYFQNFPSAIYIPKILSCISTPYFAPEAKRHLNGVLFSASNPSPGNICYLWEVSTRGKNREPPNIRPRVDGAIILTSQRRDAENPYEDIYLEPGKWEKKPKFDIKNGKTLNAFALILGIQYGGNENQPQVAPWDIEVVFGDMNIKIIEDVPEVKVSVSRPGSAPSVPENVEIQPSTAAYVKSNFGERPYLLTFIPVWNGILMSHGVPGSSDWGDTIRYFQKDPTLSINDQIYDITHVKQTQEQKDKGISVFPPWTKVKRDGEYYKAPCIFVKGKKKAQPTKSGSSNNQAQSLPSSDIYTGKRLTLRFHRCGGVFKFVPIWFTPYSRYHCLYAGAADPGDIPTESPARRNKPPKDPTGAKSGGPRPPPPAGTNGSPSSPKTPPAKGDDPTTIPSNPDVFQVTSKTVKIVLPILNFSTTDDLDFRTNLTTIVRSASKPFSCISMEFRNVEPDVRRPIQVWGAILAGPFQRDKAPPVSDEGFLTDNDLPEFKIKRFSISRSLDGASGEITFDRNDPVNGALLRQPQRIGAIRVGIFGGANTLPLNPDLTWGSGGVVFTGLAMGNSREDSPEENITRIPLKGREAKLDSDGGIVLFRAPYFDGWEHSLAMRFLADYGGVPIDWSLSTPFKLISSVGIDNPILDFPMGTSVNQAMDTITKESGSLYFFDRWGTLILIDAQRTSGRDWCYPDAVVESFSDEPDFQFMRNQVIIRALVKLPGAESQQMNLNNPDKLKPYTKTTEVLEVRVPIKTNPTFPWARYGVYTIPQIVNDRGEVIRQAKRIAEGIARPRATSRCQIPPNSDIELFDTLNKDWVIMSISHEVDTQSKKWTMSLGVELFVSASENVGTPIPKQLSQL